MYTPPPDGFSIFGLDIRFYGIISAMSYFFGVLITCLLAKKRGFTSDNILTLALYVIPTAIIGARVYYVIFGHVPFADIYKIWEGGLAFYGGLIGGGLGVLLYCFIHKKNFFALIDLIAVAMIFAQGVGRWGNFFNQEAYGVEVTNPNLQWFPFSVYINKFDYLTPTWHLATFFYESIWNFATFAILLTLLLKVKFKNNGMIAAGYLILYGIGRSWIEGLRTDSLYLGALRVSQVLSIIFIALGLGIVIFNVVKNRKKKDVVDRIIDIIKSDF